MDRAAVCSHCGGLAKFPRSCVMCGAILCGKCINPNTGICNKCAGRTHKPRSRF